MRELASNLSFTPSLTNNLIYSLAAVELKAYSILPCWSAPLFPKNIFAAKLFAPIKEIPPSAPVFSITNSSALVSAVISLHRLQSINHLIKIFKF